MYDQESFEFFYIPYLNFFKCLVLNPFLILIINTAEFYGKPIYYLLSKIDILYIISDILYRI